MKRLDQLQVEKKKEIATYKTLRDAWKNVTRNRTKSGSDFKALAKNFTGCNVRNEEYSLRPSKEIYVTDWCKDMYVGYVSDKIATTECVKYWNKPVDEKRVIKEHFLEPYFFLTIDELFELIDARIALYDKYVTEGEKELADMAAAYNKFKEGYSELINNMEKEYSHSLVYDIANEFTPSSYKYM